MAEALVDAYFELFLDSYGCLLKICLQIGIKINRYAATKSGAKKPVVLWRKICSLVLEMCEKTIFEQKFAFLFLVLFVHMRKCDLFSFFFNLRIVFYSICQPLSGYYLGALLLFNSRKTVAEAIRGLLIYFVVRIFVKAI